MNDETARSVHWSFWAISVAALIWNLMGAINFSMQMNPDAVASFPESHRAIIEGRPPWATATFGIAVFGGALGCLLLLFKKSAAFYVFIASLVGVIATTIQTLGIPDAISDFSPFEIGLTMFMPVLLAVFLIGYSKWTEGRGWIR